MRFSSIFAALLFILVLSVSSAFADVFASRVRLTNPDGKPFDGKFNDGTPAAISYVLNDTASAVVVKIMDAATNTVIQTINAGAQRSGAHTLTWDGTGSAAAKKYIVSITASQRPLSSTNYSMFKWIQTGTALGGGRGIYSRGVDANRNQMTPGFGYLYGANADTDPNGYLTGIFRMTADGSFEGTKATNPILVPSLGTTAGGTFDYGGLSPWHATTDLQGRIYFSGNGLGGNVYRMDTDSSAPKIIVRSISNPRGVAVTGSGASTKIYIAADTMVYRADIGTDDTLRKPLVLAASLGIYVKDVIVDDEGFLIVALRSGTSLSTVPGFVERYDVSGTLPVRRASATFSNAYPTGQPIGLALLHGPNPASASDDTLYVAMRGGLSSDSTTIGIHMLTMLDSFMEAKQIFRLTSVTPPSAGGNVSATADMTVDYAGNIIWFENGNEEILMISPPHTAASWSMTTREYDTLKTALTGVQTNERLPQEFALGQNYPNPFNPSTTIGFQMPMSGIVTMTVFDVLGNKVAELLQGPLDAGNHSVVWDASMAATGMYMYRLNAQLQNGTTMTGTKRMLLLK
jgi:FlgD Ig-like domain